MKVKIVYGKNKTIAFDIEDGVYIYSEDELELQNINLAVEKIKSGKSVSEVEESVFGLNAPKLYLNENEISLKRASIINIKGRDSILSELEYRKGTLLYECLSHFTDDYDVQKELYLLNEQLIKLELALNLKLKSIIGGNLQIKNILIQDLFKNYSEFNMKVDEISIPFKYLDDGNLINLFIRLIKFKMNINPQLMIVWFNTKNNFLNKDLWSYIKNELINISKSNELYYVFCGEKVVFNKFSKDDIEKNLIIKDQIIQLPPFDVFKETIMENYPSEFKYSDDELIERFYKIINLIGHDNVSLNSLSYRDMVLLMVLNHILGYDFTYQKPKFNVTDAEKSYIMSHFN